MNPAKIVGEEITIGITLSLCAHSAINAQSFEGKTRTLKNGMKILVQRTNRFRMCAVYFLSNRVAK